MGEELETTNKKARMLLLLDLKEFPKLELESLRGSNEIVEAGDTEEEALWANPREAFKSHVGVR